MPSSPEKRREQQQTRRAKSPSLRRRETAVKNTVEKQDRLEKSVSRQSEYKVVMWDGEGCNRIDEAGKKIQDYVLLCNSEGIVLKNPDLSHLDAKTVFDTLLANRGDDNTLHILFSGSYDVTMWLLSISRQESVRFLSGDGKPMSFVRSIYHSKKLKTKSLPFVVGGSIYKVEYQSRKKFTLSRLEIVMKPNKNGKPVGQLKTVETIVIWDVYGAFNQPFVKALTSFGIVTELDNIKRMKNVRKEFTLEMLQEVTEYCLSECKWGSKLYRTILNYADMQGLVLKRHDGGGAFASAMLTKENVKKHLNTKLDSNKKPVRCGSTPDKDVLLSVRRAFFGGRIENARIGLFTNAGEKDINSAYPAEMVNLPSMVGRWTEHEGFPPETPQKGCLYLVKIEWDFDLGLHFYPLPYRNNRQQVQFPSSGAGEYWFPEYESTIEWCSNFHQPLPKIHGYRKFTSDAPEERPLEFIQRYYDLRNQGDNKKSIGQVIKIGINSGYGKFAQQLGGTQATAKSDSVLPPFFCQEWAGMITSGTRAKLVKAACKLEDPNDLIGFATDAILHTGSLEIPTKKNVLGEWGPPELYSVMVVLMAGVRYQYVGTSISVLSKSESKKAHERMLLPNGVEVKFKKTPGGILGTVDQAGNSMEKPAREFYSPESAAEAYGTIEKLINDWLESNVDGWEGKSRGFPLRAMPTPYRVLEAWKAKETHVKVKVDRFYSFSTAVLGDDLWEKRGTWEEVERDIRIDGGCPKRWKATVEEDQSSTVSWRVADDVPMESNVKNVSLKVEANFVYEEMVRMGVILWSEPYANLESTLDKETLREIHEYEDQ
jgi:hypothetical protein